MNEVQPIKDVKKINEIKIYLKNKSDRNYFLFVLGINVGFRISDLLNLPISSLTGTHISITEKKTGKSKRFFINPQLRIEIDEYIKGKSAEEFLFPSRKGNRPITKIQAYNILNEAGTAAGLESIGTHTLRKTFGYWHYKQFKDVAVLQKLFNHSSPSVTLRYIGIDQDEIDSTLSGFFL